MLAIKATDNMTTNDLSLLKVFRRAINLDIYYDLESFYNDIISGNFKHYKVYKNKNKIEVKRKQDNELVFSIIE